MKPLKKRFKKAVKLKILIIIKYNERFAKIIHYSFIYNFFHVKNYNFFSFFLFYFSIGYF